MKKYPTNMAELIDMFPTEESCLDYLANVRWPTGYRCLRCSSAEIWELSNGLYRCKKCHYAASVIAGTLFQGTHKSLKIWFQAMWYVVNQKNGVSALGLQKALGLGSYHTAWQWLHKLRRAMVRHGRDKLSGTIQSNETFIGGEKSGKRGRGSEGKTLVLVAVEDNQGIVGRIRLSVIESGSSDAIIPTLKTMVEKGSTISTDGWNGYKGLSSHGYQHISVNNSDLKDDAIPLAHLIVSLLKRWLLGTHQGGISHKNLSYYLDEFTFRFNRRKSRSRGKLFYRLVQQAIDLGPIHGNDLNTTSCGQVS